VRTVGGTPADQRLCVSAVVTKTRASRLPAAHGMRMKEIPV